jgi:hypothetical protein
MAYFSNSIIQKMQTQISRLPKPMQPVHYKIFRQVTQSQDAIDSYLNSEKPPDHFFPPIIFGSLSLYPK